jgi:hypothetical protein
MLPSHFHTEVFYVFLTSPTLISPSTHFILLVQITVRMPNTG